MSYVIAEPCIDVKDKSCIEECPVDCIYEGARMLYIHPDECVDCGACEPVCPVEAIYYEDDVPEPWHDFIEANSQYFEDLGSPGGASKLGPLPMDAMLVVNPKSLPIPEYTGILREFVGLVPKQPGAVALLSPVNHVTSALISTLFLFYDRVLIIKSRDKEALNIDPEVEKYRDAGMLDIAGMDAWATPIADNLLNIWQCLSGPASALLDKVPSGKPSGQMMSVFARLNATAAEMNIQVDRDRWRQSIGSAFELIIPQLLQALSQQSELRVEPIIVTEDKVSAFRCIAAPVEIDHAATWDFEPVAPDVSAVPIDDLLEFRSEHGHHFRRHLELMRRSMREVSATPGPVDWRFWSERRDSIAESAYQLRTMARSLAPISNRTWRLGAIGDLGHVDQSSNPAASVCRRALAAAIPSADVSVLDVFGYVFSAPEWPTVGRYGTHRDNR